MLTAMPTPSPRSLASLWLCFALLALPATAAEEARPGPAAKAGAEAAAPVETGPVAIPVSEIATQATALDGFIRGIEPGFEAPANQTEIREALPEIEKDVERRARRQSQKLEFSFDRTDLDAMRAAWKAIHVDLERYAGLLQSRLTSLKEQAEDIRSRSEIWEETARAAKEEAAPAEVRAEVSGAQKKLAKASRTLRKSRDNALGLQRRVVGLQGRAQAQLDAIDSARGEVLRHLFRRNSEPVWSIEVGDFEANQESFSAALREARRSLTRYAEKHGPLLAGHALLIVALVLSCVRSRRWVLDSEGTMPPALRHPIAAGLIFGLTASVWLHPDAPPKFGLLLTTIALPMWVVVLRSVVPESLRNPVIGFAVVVPFEIAREMLVDFNTLARLMLVVEAGLIFAGLVWLRRPSRMAMLPSNPGSMLWLRVLSVWLHFSLFASAGALIGSLAGWTTAADILTTTVASGSFAGSVLFIAARAAEGIAEGSALTGRLRRIRLIHNNPQGFVRLVQRVGRAIAFVTWINNLLGHMSIQTAVLSSLRSTLSASFEYGNFNINLGGVLAFGVTLWLSWLLSRFIAAFLDQEIFTRVRLPRGVPFALSTMSRYTILVLGFVAAVAIAGVEVGNLALLVSALGVGIGFGMQNVVNNFISGLILLFERPIKVDDLISVDPLMGRVQRIGIRASVIRTFDGADVIVPNGDLISGQVTNWTLADTRRRVILPVGVVYGTPARKVIALLHEVAAANPDVISDPEPMALFTGFGDSSLDFELRIWTESDDALTLVRSALATAVQDALDAAGIEVPFPQRDLHLKTVPGLVDGTPTAPVDPAPAAADGGSEPEEES